MTMRFTPVTIGLTALAGSAALAGCGAAAHFVPVEGSVDSGKLEHNVAALVATRYRVPESTVRADCPGRIAGDRGTRVECEAQARGGRSARVFVTITSNGEASIKFDAAIVGNLDAPMVERSVARRAARHYGVPASQLTIVCPSGVHAERGARLTCAVRTADGHRGRVRLVVTSPTGKRLAFASRFTAVTRS